MLSSIRRVSLGHRGALPAIILLAILLRAIWCLFMPAQPVSDFLRYHEGAASIAAGLGYVDGAGRPTAYFPVGYSAFLSGIYLISGPSVAAAKLANILLSTMTIWICFHLFDRMLVPSGHRGGGAEATRDFALLLLACFPSQVLYTSLLSDSVLFQFLLVLGILFFTGASRWRFALSGIVFGCAALTRPYALAVPLILETMETDSAPWRSRLRRTLITYAAAIAVLIPWTIRNHRAFGCFAPISTNGGINLLIGSGAGATGAFTEAPLAPIHAAALPEPAADRLATRLAIAEIRSDPIRFIRLIPAKLFWMFADDAQALRWNLKGLPGRTASRGFSPPELAGMGVVQAYFAVVLIAAILWMARVLPRRFRHPEPPGLQFLGVWLTAYFAILAVIFFGNPRYHFPLTPFLCLYAACFVADIRSSKNK